MVHGLSGMGKTALVEHFLSEARVDGQTIVLSGRCYEHEKVPFKALDSIVDALSRYLGRLSLAEASEVMPKDVLALGHLFPVLKRVDAVRTARRRQPAPLEPRALRRAASRALKEMLARIAMRQPLLVFIDDLHWGDQDSARLLNDLMTGDERPALLLVCTYRSPDRERSPCLQSFLSGLQEQGQTDLREIELSELSERDAARLAFELLGISPADPEEVAREAKGSPYLVAQLVDHLRSEQANFPRESNTDLNVSLERALNERVEALSPAGRTVLELVAVSGRPLHERVIAGLASEGLELGEALAELRTHKLVRGVGAPDSRAIGIYHDSIREAVLGLMHADQVRNWHSRLATAIENSDAPDLEALTEHTLGAEDYSRAGIYAIRAASQATESLAFDRAADLYAIAVEHHEDEAWRQELLISWAEALVNAGRSTRAAEVYIRAAGNAEGREAAELKRQAGVQLMLSGRWLEGRKALEQALGDLDVQLADSGDDTFALNNEGYRALRERGFEFDRRASRELDREELAAIDALYDLAQATLATDPMLSATFTVAQLHRALDAGDPRRIALGLCDYFVTVDLAYSVLSGEKAKSLQAAEQVARELEDPLVRASIAFARAFNYQNDGMLQPARMEFAQAEDLFANHCPGAVAKLRACRMLYARVHVMLGQFEELAHCDAWIREAEQCEDVLTATRLRLICAHRYLMDDEVERAERALQVPEVLRGPRADLTELLRVLAQVSLLLYRGDPVAAEGLLADADDVHKSPLFAIPSWRGDHLANRARLYMLASTADTEDPERRLSVVEECIDGIAALDLESHVDHIRILRAGLAFLRDDLSTALHELNSILSDADMGGDSRIIRACARMRKGQLIGGDEGAMMIKESARELTARGVQQPERFARLYSPGFDRPEQSLGAVAAK